MKIKKNNGFTLFETLIYISILAVLLSVISNTALLMTKAYSKIKSARDMNNSAFEIMERLTREIRWSASVNEDQSVFNSDNGILSLNAVNNEGGQIQEQFYLENENLIMTQNGANPTVLNSENMQVKKMIFNLATTSVSSLVKIKFELEGKGDSQTKNFYNSAVLREGY